MSEKPTALQVLPMSFKKDPVFRKQTIPEVQESYFRRTLPNEQGGMYRYLTKGLRNQRGKLVLFQADRHIIARASLNQAKRFDEPGNAPYKGALFFDVDSIEVFNPVPWKIVQGIWPGAKKPCQVPWKLNPHFYAEFEMYLENVRGRMPST